jgi:CDP-glycerol glycerophosphotransferase (TagB/SpsB family)
MDDFDEQDFNEYLEKNNVLLLMKPHPQDEFFYKEYLKKHEFSQNIKLIFDSTLKENDFYFYEIFSMCDLMIGDYSSIIIDWLILKKPVIYLSTVVDEYIGARGMCLEDNYKMLLPGMHVSKYPDLMKEIIANIQHPDLYSNTYGQQLNLLHKYFDGDSCERIYNVMQTL